MVACGRVYAENYFVTDDNEQLFYRYWPAESEEPVGALVLFHRGHEHSGRITHLVDELNLPNYCCFAWDARGHGRSPGMRGHSPSLGTSIRDVQNFISHIVEKYNIAIENIAVIAQSVGAVLVAAWVHDYAPNIRCMVLASPAFNIKLYVPMARYGLKLLYFLRGNFSVNSYVKAKFLTHDPERIASFEADPLISRSISVNILLAVFAVGRRVVADAAALTTPTQLLVSGADWVVHHRPQHEFYERLGSPIKERYVLPRFYHDTLGEKDRGQAIEKVRTFIEARFAEPFQRQSLMAADKVGYTRSEADRLATPLSPLSLQAIYWKSVRSFVKLAAVFSEGIALGHKSGFDSGSTLDYVYRNQARGVTPLGTYIDRLYLNSIGWRGIRTRKEHVKLLLGEAMSRLRQAKTPIHIVDAAAGHGRYILEAIELSDIKPDSVLFRDFLEENVAHGRALIREKGLDGSVRFEQGDAFDPESFRSVEPHATVGVVSGLYELYADNDAVRASLSGYASCISPGGYLIYTGQPWHPQLECIARALTSHRGGQAWIMRRRTQAELDQLVESAGFRKVAQRIDEEGIFTVSLAVREEKP